MPRHADRSDGRTRYTDCRGFALITVLVMTMVVTFIGLAFYGVAGYEIRQAQYQRDYAQAFWAAETGLDRTVNWLEDPAMNFQPPESAQEPFTGEAIGNGTYDVELIPQTGNGVENTYLIVSTGRSGKAVRVLEEVVRLEGFQRYGYFTNEEVGSTGDPIWFVTGDDIGGKTHTNGIFHIAGSPQFRGAVTTASDHMVGNPGIHVHEPSGWPAGSNNPIFHEGLTIGSSRIELPNDTGDLLEAALAGGLSLTGDYELKFAADGTVSYRVLPGGAFGPPVELSTLSSGVIHVSGNADMSGVLDGEITVGASGNINLVGDMVYADANTGTGQPSPGCNDVMGIVAGGDVIVKDVPPGHGGEGTHGNMIIDATVMALSTSFRAENFNTGARRGTIRIWGGLIQERRGQVGYSVGTTLLNGYEKDYHYDDRVTLQPPPQFPLTGIYIRESWRERGPDA